VAATFTGTDHRLFASINIHITDRYLHERTGTETLLSTHAQ
jgi:hypothetical protein